MLTFPFQRQNDCAVLPCCYFKWISRHSQLFECQVS